MYKFGKRSLERLEGVHPTIVKAFSLALADKNCPHDVGIPQLGGLRTVADQQGLFAQGRSDGFKKKPIVTWVDGVNKKSNHQAKEDGFGYAVDVYIFKDGKAHWNRLWLEEFARHVQKVAKEKLDLTISWGGDWKRKDRPHFEVLTGILPSPVKKAKEVLEKKPVVKKTTVKKKAVKKQTPKK